MKENPFRRINTLRYKEVSGNIKKVFGNINSRANGIIIIQTMDKRGEGLGWKHS